MIDRGEPYMIMEKIEAAQPQNSFLALPWRAKRDTKATPVKMASTRVRRPRILPFSFFAA